MSKVCLINVCEREGKRERERERDRERESEREREREESVVEKDGSKQIRAAIRTLFIHFWGQCCKNNFDKIAYGS